ncbi:MAG TPA: hypothetical protein VGG70_01480 [Candidatus Cybelea sp.]
MELVNTLATLGTFVVIAATAIAAIVQLSDARSSNQIAALNELRETMETLDFQDAQQFVMAGLQTRVRDPAFRHQYFDRSARTDEGWIQITKVNRVGNFFETLGTLVKAGMVDRELTLEVLSGNIAQGWALLAPITAIVRRREGAGLWENFEYITVLSQDWLAAHPTAPIPRGCGALTSRMSGSKLIDNTRPRSPQITKLSPFKSS